MTERAQRWPIPDDEILRIQEEGRADALEGKKADACPYRPGTSAEEADDRFRQQMWLRGYHHARAEIEANRPS